MRNIFSYGSKLHLRHLRLIVISLALPTFIIGGCLYYLIFSLVAKQIAIPEFIAHLLFPALEKINAILLIGLPFVILAILSEGIIVSARLAGPINRLRKEMEEIEKGNYSKRIELRKNDELKPIADSVNKILEKMGGGN